MRIPLGSLVHPKSVVKLTPAHPWAHKYARGVLKSCAKWAQGSENDTQTGPKRSQMVLKGRLKWSQSGTRRSLKGPQTYKQINSKHVVENWQAFRHVVQCLSKWNLQAE